MEIMSTVRTVGMPCQNANNWLSITWNYGTPLV